MHNDKRQLPSLRVYSNDCTISEWTVTWQRKIKDRCNLVSWWCCDLYRYIVQIYMIYWSGAVSNEETVKSTKNNVFRWHNMVCCGRVVARFRKKMQLQPKRLGVM